MRDVVCTGMYGGLLLRSSYAACFIQALTQHSFIRTLFFCYTINCCLHYTTYPLPQKGYARVGLAYMHYGI